MRRAKANEQIVSAGPDSPKVGICPACGGIVEKRKRRKMDGQLIYFYRHRRGEGEECPFRYSPTS